MNTYMTLGPIRKYERVTLTLKEPAHAERAPVLDSQSGIHISYIRARCLGT